jgi:hypothetical protein
MSGGSAKLVKIVESVADVGSAIAATTVKPDVALSPSTPEVGFIHRKLDNGDIYFIANTDNRPHAFDATFRTDHPGAESWNPFNGQIANVGKFNTLHLSLAPYESRVFVFTNHAQPAPENPVQIHFDPIDLSHDWKITFDKTGVKETMPTLESWTNVEGEKYYSGTATYERSVEIPGSVARAGQVLLDFGVGAPIERTQLHQAGTRTWYDAPLRDAALVYVNGKLAGSVWHPPYNIDVGPFLHAGANDLKIVVANTAINELAGRAGPDYRLLNLRYGERFTPQDMDHLEPQPSGILGPLRLISAQDAEREENPQ